MSSFPLFRLPFVPIRSILEMVDSADKINLSMTSKKTYRMIEASGKSVSLETFPKKWQRDQLNVLEKFYLLLLEVCKDSEKFFEKYHATLSVDVSNNIVFELHVNSGLKRIFDGIRVDFEHVQDKLKGTKGNLKIGDVNVPIVMRSQQRMSTLWENKLAGFQMFGDWIIQTFKPRINVDIITPNETGVSKNLRIVVDWINSDHQENIGFLNVTRNTKITDEDFKLILDNIHPKVTLRLFDQRDTTGFQHDTHFKSNNLILRADWFTLDNLLMTECQDIRLSESKLTTEELTEYLKQWLAGRFSTLKYLRVETKGEFDFEQMINRLSNGSMRVDDQLVHYTFTRGDGSISFKRHDGKVAKISTPGGYVKTFKMDVSSD